MMVNIEQFVTFGTKRNLLLALTLIVLGISSQVFHGCSDDWATDTSYKDWERSQYARDNYANDPNKPKFFVPRTVKLTLNKYEMSAIELRVWYDGGVVVDLLSPWSEKKIVTIYAGTWTIDTFANEIREQPFIDLKNIFERRGHPYLIKDTISVSPSP